MSLSPILRRLLLGSSVFLAGTAALLALHPKNAGPESFSIKFKLPEPPVLTPEEALKSFEVAPGFEVQLVAAEPLVEAPIALSWDGSGKLFVCEMRPYMHDVEGSTEDQATGRISVLEDKDGDGRMDIRTTFAEGFVMPRSVTCVNGGVLVGEPPNLWFLKDTDGDGKADVKELVEKGFGTADGQPEHMANSPTWFLDNYIYCANHATRYRLRDGKFVLEPAVSWGQYGLSQDDFGRPYYNFNSDFLRGNAVPDALYLRNPNYAATAGAGLQILKEQTVWPSHPTPGVNRGYEPKALREDGTLTASTATCGAGIYRGDLFPQEFRGNAFIPEPAANIVKRVILEDRDGIQTAKNAYRDTEFWSSTDERFRPVNAYTGPEGALYVVDMYRGIIQHKGFLTHYLIANIKDRKLEQPVDKGRIWRVVPKGSKPVIATVPKGGPELVAALESGNGWMRDIAQRLLVEGKDAALVPAIMQTAASGKSPLARLHALWTLEGVGAVNAQVVTAALQDESPRVRAAGVAIADRSLLPQLRTALSDSAREVQVALGFALSAWPEAEADVQALARRAGGEPMVCDAILSGLRGRELETLEALLAKETAAVPARILSALSQAVIAERRPTRVAKLLTLISAQVANSTEQQALLTGAGVKMTGAKGKLLYLPEAPAALATLISSADAKTKPLLATVDARLAWPGKKGVPPPPVIRPLSAPEQALFDQGKTLYATICAACHQPSGLGMAGLAPALVDSEWVLGQPEVLPRVLLHGLSGPIKVSGQPWNLEMPPLGAALSDEQIAAILTYIRREWDHGANPVAPALVAEIRAQHKDRTRAWTAEELSALLAPKSAQQEAKR